MMICGLFKNLQNCTLSCKPRTAVQASKRLLKSSWNLSRNCGDFARERQMSAVGRWSRLHRWICKNVQVLQRHLTEQCEFVVAQRVRRAYQIWMLYSQLYSEGTMRAMVTKLGKKLVTQEKPLGLLLGTALFNWDKENITDDDMMKCACDFGEVELLLGTKLPYNTPRLTSAVCQSQDTASWELVINKDSLKVWRKAVDKSYLYEYKVFGSFFDIPARAFFRVQTDTEYRKTWDKLVIKLEIIDRKALKDKNNSQAEVLHWVMHYPYPMYSRDYVYVRRYMVDEQNKLIVFVSRATTHPDIPVDKSYVRVDRYKSQMVIRPHLTFDANGFDYVLTYFDDPQAAFPGPAYNWMATSGVPDFVEKLHSAAVNLLTGDDQQGRKPKRFRTKQCNSWRFF